MNAVLSPRSDRDWYVTHAKDETTASLEPKVALASPYGALETDSLFSLCAYVEGDRQQTCDIGYSAEVDETAADGSAMHLTGCCAIYYEDSDGDATPALALDLDHSWGDDSTNVYLSVALKDPASAEASCYPYKLGFWSTL